MRSHFISRIAFMGFHFRMNSIKDEWGVDDVVVAELGAGSYGEADALSWWRAMVDCAAPGAILIDAGAYTGLYSLLAAAARGNVRTLALEASVITHGRLVQNILTNGYDMRILPCHVAVGELRGMVELGHAFGPFAMASGESLEPTYETDHTEIVPAISLDDLVFQTEATRFGPVASRALGIVPPTSVAGIKIDVEGVEFSVLKGARRLLAEFKPPLIVEILDERRRNACEMLLADHGYRYLAECPGQNHVYAHMSKAADLEERLEQFRAAAASGFAMETILSYSL